MTLIQQEKQPGNDQHLRQLESLIGDFNGNRGNTAETIQSLGEQGFRPDDLGDCSVGSTLGIESICLTADQ